MDSAVPRGPDRRKEWRAVPQEPEHGKHGHSDERTIYEEGAGPLQVDYCSITIDGGDDMLRERLQEIARQQQELHQMEVGLRAHAMARSEFAGMQNEYEARVKEHADAAAALKEQLHERERQLRDMAAKLDEKDRELRAVKIDNEAAWAKEDLLREQNKELATYRRERDNSEAERAQHLQKIHELQEHVQEKESQFLALEEQHRVAQETILFKDEQLREAQTWIARAQDAASNQAQEKVFPSSQQQTAVSIASSTAESHPMSSLKVADHIDIKQISGLSVPGKAVEPTLLDSMYCSRNSGWIRWTDQN